MAPPKKEIKVGNKSLIETYFENLSQQPQENPESVLGVNGDEDAESEITYFVDEKGCYYYQTSATSQNLINISTNVGKDAEGLAEAQMMVDGDENYQTVALVPSDNENGEVSYVFVVQEDNKPILTAEQAENEKAKNESEDVYTFEEDEEEGEAGEEGSDVEKDDDEPDTKKKKRKRSSSFPCPFCSYSTPRRYLLLRHLKTHSDERPHKCHICERGFKTISSLQNHVNMHNGVKPHVCKYCNTPFTTSGELVRHVRYKHTHERPHKCTECDYASVELSKLRRHVRCHTGERPYQCPHCTYASPDTFKLKRHLRTHTGEKPYKCELCSMRFSQSNSLKAHKLIHNVADKPVYACELCPAKCGRKTDLRIHIQKMHTSDKPIKCKRCGKSFPDRYSCKLHNKTHEGEKCFKCEYCPYASSTLRHLKSHVLKHTDEKPFQCEKCDQSFRQKQLLRRHHNLYHNPDYVPKPPKEKTHVCRECNRHFAHRGNLIRHLAVHDPESGYRENMLALKIGRQRKIKPVSDNAVDQDESIVDYEDEEEEEEEQEEEEPEDIEMEEEEALQEENNDKSQGVEIATIDGGNGVVAVSDGDAREYVVLEVIEVEDGKEQQIAVVAADSGNNVHYSYDTVSVKRLENSRTKQKNVPEEQNKVEKDVDTCFGFDEEGEEPEDDELPEDNKMVL